MKRVKSRLFTDAVMLRFAGGQVKDFSPVDCCGWHNCLIFFFEESKFVKIVERRMTDFAHIDNLFEDFGKHSIETA
jgi:hypothetical protein